MQTLVVAVVQQLPHWAAKGQGALKRLGYHIVAVLIALDCLVSALVFGGPYSTISARVGMRMADPESPLARWTWPAWWRSHCLGAVRQVWTTGS